MIFASGRLLVLYLYKVGLGFLVSGSDDSVDFLFDSHLWKGSEARGEPRERYWEVEDSYLFVVIIWDIPLGESRLSLPILRWTCK
jgi:hypothetical protein